MTIDNVPTSKNFTSFSEKSSETENMLNHDSKKYASESQIDVTSSNENFSATEEKYLDNSKKSVLNISELDDFNKIAETLDNLEASQREKSQETKNPTNEQLPQETGENNTKVPANEQLVDDLLKTDTILQRLDTLIESGFTQEEAEKRVYGEEYKEIPSLEDVSTEDFNTPQIQQWLNVGDNEYNALKNAYNNPPDSALLYHLNNSEEYKKALGDEAGTITTLDLYSDELENLHFKKNLIEDYRRTVKVFLNNIENARGQKDALIAQQNKLQDELCTDFFKDYPELNNDNPVSEKMAVHFVHRMKTKLDKLTPKDCQDIQTVKKVFNATKKEFSVIYPHLQKKFGVAPKPAVNPSLLNQKLQQMQTMTTEPTNNFGNANFTVKTTGDDFSDIAGILNNLDKLK